MSLARRFEEAWADRGWTEPGDRIVVACSGGLDSLTLLHLLRFGCPGLELRPAAAHFDHRMRPGSVCDAEWVRGVARAWEVGFEGERAREVPASEKEARELRYEFLHGLAARDDVRWVLTAHHADDQIETVLFRIVRGTGIEGLRGIPEVREPGILRPLLPFSRGELEGYAARHRLRPRTDPTNRSLRFARNRIRHELLPLLEQVHPGARAAILRLARNSDRAARALDRLLEQPLDEVTLETRPGFVELARDGLLSHPEPVRAELVRTAAGRVGAGLDEAGTATALEFISTGSSGGGIELSGGVTLTREFDRIRLSAAGARTTPGSRPRVSIPSADPGRGEIRLGGRRYELAWGDRSGPRAAGEWVDLARDRLAFPLEIRGWAAGDRTRTAGGTKKLGKLFIERRVPRSERAGIPLLVDADGRVIWIAGTHVDPHTEAGPDEAPWPVGVRDVGPG